MSAGLLIGCIVLVFFGPSVALFVWFVLRLTIGGIWAAAAFYVLLISIAMGIFQLTP